MSDRFHLPTWVSTNVQGERVFLCFLAKDGTTSSACMTLRQAWAIGGELMAIGRVGTASCLTAGERVARSCGKTAHIIRREDMELVWTLCSRRLPAHRLGRSSKLPLCKTCEALS